MERRHFIKRLTQFTVGFGLFKTMPNFTPLANGQMPQNRFDVGIVTGSTKEAVRKAVDLVGGMKSVVKPGYTVVLKPNMGFPNPPEIASTTNPSVVKAVAELCVEAGAKKILVLDHPLRRPEVCLKRNGILDEMKDVQHTHIFLATDQKFYQEVSVPKGKVLQKVEILKDVLHSDVLINIPIAKSHNGTGVTLGLKGLMGVIYDREYFHQQVDLNQAIADLNTVIKPHLTIIDATRVMTAGGPTGPGTVEQLNTIVASKDPIAADAAAVPLAKWYGHQFTASQVKHIKLAHELGLGEIDLDKLNVKRVTLHA